MKTSELSDTALDWAVAKCEGYTNLRKNPHRFSNDMLVMTAPRAEFGVTYLCDLDYSTSWGLGGPLLEREIARLEDLGDEGWEACGYGFTATGPTPLIAAMRCFVSSRLGDEVEIPEELL